jgi:phosphoribosylamine--glycine ligase
MKVLVVGSGGREHALVWKIAQSPKVAKIFAAPGNAGIAELATCVPIAADDIDRLLAFALEEAIDLSVIGPEDPLSRGIVDRFEKAGLRIFGASGKAAEIESSKSFAKSLMVKYQIPTASGETFTDHDLAAAYIRKMGAPIVVKADGLAAGKGVIVCDSVSAALEALDQIIIKKEFGAAGNTVVIEECLVGEEASFLAFSDGKTLLPLPSSQDHKPVYDNDQGPNTGGMGAYSPAPLVDTYLHKRIMQEIMYPTIRGMAAEGRPYKGVLYAGLMIDKDKIRVLEFNGRFGDPEAQPLLIRMKNDIIPIMEAVIDGRLDQCTLDIDPRASVCVVMASGGYPKAYQKGKPIAGLDAVLRMQDVVAFHAGTALVDNRVVTAGGRVLGVTALGDTVAQAIERAYQAVAKIHWQDVHSRTDIGKKALVRMQVKPLVGVVMGSESDLSVMESAVGIFKKFEIPFEMSIVSAHRSPGKAAEYAGSAKARGLCVIIAGAGHAAHLAGAMAAHTTLPIIGVPIDSSCLKGLDALLSTVQMPPGVPVATVSLGTPGAKNAAILAAQILALADPELAARLESHKTEMATQLEAQSKKLEGYR